MDFKDLLKLAGRRWKSIVGFFVLGILISGAYSLIATPVYQSTAKIFISVDSLNPAQAFYAGAFGTQRVQSYADLATSGQVMHRVIKKLDLKETPDELAGKISATVPTNTVIIQIQAKDTNARTAQRIAQVEASQLSRYLTQVERPTGKAAAPVKATVTDRAQYDDNAVSPRTALNVAVGAVLGLLVGIAVAITRDVLDTTVKTPEDVEALTSAPLMTRIVNDPDLAAKPLLTDLDTHSQPAEAFRLLRTNLHFVDLDADPRMFLVTSAVPGEGKTTVATNLALALAQAGQRVLLVDADLRRPRVADLLGLEASVGLTTVLVGRSSLEDSIQRHSASGVSVLTTGPIPPNPTEVLQARATRDLFKVLRDRFDQVIIDAPPLLPVADAAVLATEADGALMVVRHGSTTRAQATQALTRLEHVSARLYGVTLNMVPKRQTAGDYYGYGYGDGYAAEPAG